MQEDGSTAERTSEPSNWEKWEAEQRFRERELELRQAELKRNNISNPLVIAIFTAAAALAGNVYSSLHTADVERERAENALILESIRTGGDLQKTRDNLQFLAGAKLLSGSKRDDLIAFLDDRSKATPSLASGTANASPFPIGGREHFDFPVVNRAPINPRGLDIDVFSCEQNGQLHTRAKQTAEQLANAADTNTRIGRASLGRIRFTTGRNWSDQTAIVADPSEMSFAKSLAERLATVAGGPLRVVANDANTTGNYLSVFFCSTRAS